MLMNEFTNAERAEVLTQALPYIKLYNQKIVVVKYGGNAMINEQLKEQVMEDIVLLHLIGVKIVLVHGGGPEISELMARLGKQPVFVDGLRVTDKETVDIVQMVLAGKVNKSLVNLLESKGGRAMGISGIDGGLIEAEMKDPRLGYVGNITGINIHPVQKFKGSVEAGITKMLEFKIKITRRSSNVQKEFRNYTYAQDKEGRWLNQPIDAFNHAIDAVRYVVISEILGGMKKPVDLKKLARLAHR